MITLNNKKLCENCFSETTVEPCPHCGFSSGSYRQDPVSLKVGSVLSQRYLIGGVIGKGGFGITYLAYDLKLSARIAVKEYYPMGLAMRNPGTTIVSVSDQEAGEAFRTGAEKFYNEAKMVAQFNGNPNIVSVHDFFYENDTVYFVMGYLQGQTLKSYIKKRKITEGQAVNILNQITNALVASHALNILHRDISPDNIMLCDDGTIRLLDFGAARQVVAEESQSLSVILKQGFAPLEQYQKKGKQGPWTDIYALGATIYNALTGDMPADPMSRLEDDSEYESNKYGISEKLWNIISKCTAQKISDRYQDVGELKEELAGAGIEAEAFNDINEEITDILRGRPGSSSTGLTGTGVFSTGYTKETDPNATVLLAEQTGKASNETVALNPEEASAFTGGNISRPEPELNSVPDHVPQPDKRPAEQPVPQAPSYVQPQGTPGINRQVQPVMQQEPQPIRQPVQQNMQAQYPPQQPGVQPQRRPSKQPGRPQGRTQKKKGMHPVLIVLLSLAGLFVLGFAGLILIGIIASSGSEEIKTEANSEAYTVSAEDKTEADSGSAAEVTEAKAAEDGSEDQYIGTYNGYALYENGSYITEEYNDMFKTWYVKLDKGGEGYLYLGDDNKGDLTSWSMDGDKLKLEAGASVFEGKSCIKDGVMLLDFDDFIIIFLSSELDPNSLE